MSITNEKDPGGVVEAGVNERRHNLRFPFTASVEVTESKSGARITGRTSDLGLGGCYVDAICPFPVGTDAAIRITRGDEFFEAQAKVVYSQIGMGMGIAFVSAKPRQVRLFQRWLQEISGKVPLAPDVPVQTNNEVDDVKFKEEKDYVLSELLIALIRKGILTEVEGKAMLRKLHQ